MADGPTIIEVIISQLGTPPQPLEVTDLLFLGGLVAAALAWAMLEYGLGRALARAWRHLQSERGQKPRTISEH